MPEPTPPAVPANQTGAPSGRAATGVTRASEPAPRAAADTPPAPPAQAPPPRFSTALIVDDAYDPISAQDLPEQVRAFSDAVDASERQAELRAALAAFGCPREGELTLPGDAMERLYGADALDPELKEQLEHHLFNDTRQKRAQVRALSEGLAARGINVVTRGAGEDLPTDAPDIVFLDYYLGALNNQDARTQAVTKLKAIEAAYVAHVPFIVLMSSATVNPVDQGSFREESGWVAGLFDFSPKSELVRRESLGKLVTLWEMLLPYRLHVFSFVHAVNESVKRVYSEFMARVRSLGIEDYAFLQRLELAGDGQPLGEYMLWLFGSALPHMAFDGDPGVSTTAGQLDRLRFESLLPGSWEPSATVAECYRLAISTPAVGPVAQHPLHSATPGSKGLPYLQTGDLLMGPGLVVWLIASPACDIAFAPGSDRDDPSRYVVLVPGELERLSPQSATSKTGEVVTPLFEREGVAYRIRWKPTRPEYIRHGTFDDWCKEVQAERKARLRLPYALEVQQAFAHNLVRIGMPVPPPMPFNATVHVHYEGPDGLCAPAAMEGAAGARLFLLRKARRCHLNYDAIRSMVAAIGTVRQAWETKRLGLKHKTQQDDLDEALGKLAKLQTDSAEWAGLVRDDFDLPAGAQHTKIATGLVQVYYDTDFKGVKFPGKDKDRPALVVSVVESAGIEVSEAPAKPADVPVARTTKEGEP